MAPLIVEFQVLTMRRCGKLVREEEGMGALALRLWREEEGQDLTEYALLLVLIALAAVASVNKLATAIDTAFNNAAANLNTAAGRGGT